MASGKGVYMSKKLFPAIDYIPEVCPKCGKRSLELRDNSTAVCLYDGWTYYLSEIAVKKISEKQGE